MKTFTNQNKIFKFFRDLPQLSITSRESIFNTMRCQLMFRIKLQRGSRRMQLGPVSLVITTHQVNVTMPYSQFSLTSTGLFALLGRATSGVGLFTRLLLLLLLALWKEQQKKKKNCCVPYWVVALDKWIQLQVSNLSFKLLNMLCIIISRFISKLERYIVRILTNKFRKTLVINVRYQYENSHQLTRSLMIRSLQLNWCLEKLF